MSNVNLPSPQMGKNTEETVQILFDTVMKLRKELDFLLQNLDSKNVSNIDASLTDVENLSADSITTGTLDAEKVNVINLTAETIDATTIVTNTIVTESLYADKAVIAELTVDRFDTSTKVQNYLDEDTSDVNYIRIQNQEVEFVEATTDGLTDVQLTNRDSEPLYWIDATSMGITTTVTAYPVMIYVYTEVVKMKLSFVLKSGVYTPIMQWGIGTGDGDNGKGFLEKTASGFEFRYMVNDVDQILTNGDDGILVSGCDTQNPNIRNIWDGTEAEYNAITTKDSKTVYLIHS